MGDLPTDLWLAAQIRIAAQSGISIFILRKGADHGGSVMAKVNRLDGTAALFAQVQMENETVWMPAGQGGFIAERQADEEAARETSFDPDLWLVEIEDKQGRLWLEGRVVEEA